MVLTRIKAQLLTNQFNIIGINQQVHIAAPTNYVIGPFEGKINTGYTTGIKIYPQSTKEKNKETENLDISV